MIRTLAAVGIVLVAAGSLAAQVPDSVRADPTARDSTDFSELFLKTFEAGRHRVPVFPRLGRAELMAPLGRIVYHRDSLEWHNMATLSDLLAKVPGVFVWRGGWLGRPEPINFQGRATASMELVIDGVPYQPLGPDSVAVDPSLLPMTFFDRVEIERLPGQLRVHLFSRRHDRLPPRTKVGVASGDFQIARYIASLEKRTAAGFGYVVAAEHLAVPLRSGDQGSYSNTQTWFQASYAPVGRIKAMVQLFRSVPKREDVVALLATGGVNPAGDTLSQGLDGHRADFQASAVYQARPDGLGFRGVAIAGSSSWREDSTAVSLGGPNRHVKYVDQQVWQLGGQAGFRTRTSNLEARAWYRNRWTPLEFRATAASTPTRAFGADLEGVYQRHEGDRRSAYLSGRVGVNGPGGLRIGAMGRTGSRVVYPMLAAASAVPLTDLAGTVAWERARVGVEVGYWRTAAFSPERYPLYRTIDTIGPSGPTRWLTVAGRVAPKQWFILDGWYSNPIGTKPEGIPPTHSIVNLTIQSRFLPTFRSGIFGLKLQGSMETWGTGVIGRDQKGLPITERGATFFRAQIQLKIGDFIAYYDRANFQAARAGYLPNLPVLRLASSFGVRWEFAN